MAAMNFVQPTSLNGWNLKKCLAQPVFSAKKVNKVDFESIAFISQLQLNTVGSFSELGSFVLYGPATQKIKALSAPQELALCGALPLGVPAPVQGSQKDLSTYLVPFGGDTPSGGVVTIVWPSPPVGVEGTVTQVYITGRDMVVTNMTGATGEAVHGTWLVLRSGNVATQNVTVDFSSFRAGVAPNLMLHFEVPIARLQ
jgi:hypothetical protein